MICQHTFLFLNVCVTPTESIYVKLIILTGPKEKKKKRRFRNCVFVYLFFPFGNMQVKKLYQVDRCELPLSSSQGQVLFSEDAVVTLWNGLGLRDPRLQLGSEASFLKSVVSQPEES